MTHSPFRACSPTTQANGSFSFSLSLSLTAPTFGGKPYTITATFLSGEGVRRRLTQPLMRSFILRTRSGTRPIVSPTRPPKTIVSIAPSSSGREYSTTWAEEWRSGEGEGRGRVGSRRHSRQTSARKQQLIKLSMSACGLCSCVKEHAPSYTRPSICTLDRTDKPLHHITRGGATTATTSCNSQQQPHNHPRETRTTTSEAAVPAANPGHRPSASP